MAISPTSISSEIQRDKPISARTKAFYRRRLQNRIHRLIVKAFREQAKTTGLTQKRLAERIESRPEQINRWLGIAGNWTLNTVSDLLLGMAVDLDDPTYSIIAELEAEAAQQQKVHEKFGRTSELGAGPVHTKIFISGTWSDPMFTTNWDDLLGQTIETSLLSQMASPPPKTSQIQIDSTRPHLAKPKPKASAAASTSGRQPTENAA
jgi:hypothetical protein